MKNAFLTGLLLTIFSLFVVSSAHAQRMSPDIVCSDGITCNEAGTTCFPTDAGYGELMLVHRLEVTIGRTVRPGKLFIEECFNSPYGAFCLPAPVSFTPGNPGELGTYTMKNLIQDSGPNDPYEGVSIVDDKESFMLALEEQCIESYLNQSEGMLNCRPDPLEPAAHPGIARLPWLSGVGLEQINWLVGLDYHSFGVYKNTGAQLQPVLQHPSGAARNEKYEMGTRTSDGAPRFTRVVVYYAPPTGGIGGDPSDKIGTLGFPASAESCAATRTSSPDPYGRVFNKDSLQPVEGVDMVVYKEMTDTVNPSIKRYEKINPTDPRFEIQDPFFRNPYRTDAVGGFSFVVPAGNYKLLALSNANSAPTILATPITLPFNQLVMDLDAKALGDEVKVSVGGEEHYLYPPDASMGSRAKVYGVENPPSAPGTLELPVITVDTQDQRRDISSTRNAAGMKVLWNNRVTDVVSGDEVFTGRMNKPFGNIFAETPAGATISSARADAKGDYTILVPGGSGTYNLRYQIEPLQRVTPTPQAKGFGYLLSMFTSQLFPVVYAADSGESLVVPVEPRLNHLEGYAYGASGEVLKGAEVLIYDTLTSLPSYSTKTDQNGFYIVYSENLPAYDYRIAYRNASTKQIQFVSNNDFLTKNAKYLETSKVNLMEPKLSEKTGVYLTQHPLPSVTRTQSTGVGPKQGTPGQLNQGVAPTRAVEQNNPANQLSPALLMYVAILLLLIVGAGLLIVYYMKRKQEPHLYE